MTNWSALLARLNKAERDAQEWADGLKDAEKTLAEARAEMAAALGPRIASTWPTLSKNGSEHKGSPAPVPKVKKRSVRHDFKRKLRILALLKEKGGFLTVADVIAAEKVSAPLATGCLAAMVTTGKLTRVSRGRYAAKPVAP